MGKNTPHGGITSVEVRPERGHMDAEFCEWGCGPEHNNPSGYKKEKPQPVFDHKQNRPDAVFAVHEVTNLTAKEDHERKRNKKRVHRFGSSLDSMKAQSPQPK